MCRTSQPRSSSASLPSLLAMAIAASMSSQASAFVIDTGNPDVKLRLDNTVRYNASWRVEGQDDDIVRNSRGLYDESDLKFDRGDMVQNRLDVLTEFDMIFRDSAGFRVSAATWYDDAYKDDDVKTNPSSALQSSYDSDNYSSKTERYYRGLSGEILDAFVFSRFNVGEVPVNVKAGRHTIYWGEGLFFPGHSIAYSQAPIDGRKAAATPGVEAKETFLPLGQLSTQAQVTDNLSLAAQYFVEWKPTRAPEGGTYLAPSDIGVAGPDRFPLVPGGLLPFAPDGYSARRVDPKEPDNRGNWGISARWNAEALDATLGFYYREFDDYNPGGLQLLGNYLGLGLPEGYRFVHVENTKLYGFSMAKQVGTASVGLDLSHRHGTGLTSSGIGVDDKPAIGNTWHVALSAIQGLTKTQFWDAGVWQTEVVYSYLDKVTHNEQLFNGEDYASCAGKDKWDGCATRNFAAIASNFTPQLLQVFPSVDLEFPLTVNYGLYGNAAAGGGNQGAMTWSAGVKATYDQLHEVTLRYTDQSAHTKYDDVTGAVIGGNGNVGLTDRGYVSLTFKTSF